MVLAAGRRESLTVVKSLAIVTAFYPPSVGGVERFSREFARAAIAQGVRVNVITTARIKTPDVSVEDGGIRVLRLPAYYVPISGSYFPIPLAGPNRLAEFLECDVVLAQTRFFLTTLLAAFSAARHGRRIHVLDHGSGPLRANPAFSAASMAYERAVTAALKAFAPRFLAVSSASAAWLSGFNIQHAGILPNGIAARAEMPVRSPSAGRTVVFFAGRLLPDKGVRELTDAVELLAGEGYDVALRIAGQGPLAAWLAARASRSAFLTFLGPLSPERVAAELDDATVFVNPSNYAEGLPTILLEAGSAALPVISTPRGGSTELIANGDTGWVISRGEPALIAAALRDAIAQPHEAIGRGARLFRLIQERFTWPTIVRTFLGQVAVCGEHP